ncbi:MAG: gamma carbonic anhydrase family protein [Rhodospirillaceae bacterium]|nr:gamma carbonic anhydrase family protein [Rhodospirillaceae bacterium]|tara:strand:- start:271 stop:807 length:537 start_codon:yes stop_codon:yes gene_type:complete
MAYHSVHNSPPIILPFEGKKPEVADSAFIAPGAVLVGDVKVGHLSSVWFGCILRADEAPIVIGNRSNLQDGTVIHVHGKKQGTFIGDNVSVGHMCLLHACSLESNSFVGMGAQILDEAVVESGAMLAAGALLTARKTVPHRQLWAGRPAKFLREITKEYADELSRTSENYVEKSFKYR